LAAAKGPAPWNPGGGEVVRIEHCTIACRCSPNYTTPLRTCKQRPKTFSKIFLAASIAQTAQ
ncbi:hypothetical protein, partial [Hymenobacter terricola]|uniref:hypothetical protein n=1 Tax=Hymenobacter terricola TaxID=2819236 RepID=UPI001CF41EF9